MPGLAHHTGRGLRGIYDVDPATPASITAFAPGYIDEDKELIVGLQTDAPLKRAIMPNGGLRMVEAGLTSYGYHVDPLVRWSARSSTGTGVPTTTGVFDAYTAAMRAARKAGIVTGQPDVFSVRNSRTRVSPISRATP